MVKQILVTGSEGYIGSVLVNNLLRQGFCVTGFDTAFYGRRTGKKKNYTFRKIDLRDIKSVDLSAFNSIIHLAALSNDPMGALSPKLTDDINYKATILLARKAKKEGVKKFLFSSSCSVYGLSKSGFVNEKSQVNPLTEYAKSKIKTEKALAALADRSFHVGLLRNSTVYGYSSNFRNDLVVNNLVTTALAYDELRIMSDGTPWRPLIDVRDLSTVFIHFLTQDTSKVNGKPINIGFNNSNFQVKDIVKKIKGQIPSCKIVFTNEHGTDARSYRVKFDMFNHHFPEIKQKWPMSKSIEDMIKELKKLKFSRKDFESGRYTRISVLKRLLQKNKLSTSLRWRNI